MNNKLILFILCTTALIFLSSCSSTTVIHSRPEGAKLYMDHEYMGMTPYTYSDTKIVGSSTSIRLVMDGYDTFEGVLVRSERPDVGAIIGGIFVFVPFLWVMQYNPYHTYDLFPAGTSQQPPPQTIPQTAPPPPTPPQQGQSLSNDQLDRLQKLKKLYDDKVLTKEEFEREKQKILDQK
ncbi:MAG TPA: PEGA domain-containing protein [Candidatus Kapabacteria bacterium]|nr:PEGA domain-containing protein [Candidatus Kapabacteria bacterium]